MIGLLVLGIVLILYGLLCLAVGLFKFPPVIWNMSKIQGFVNVLGKIGTQIFISVWGAAALVGGIYLVIANLPE